MLRMLVKQIEARGKIGEDVRSGKDQQKEPVLLTNIGLAFPYVIFLFTNLVGQVLEVSIELLIMLLLLVFFFFWADSEGEDEHED